VITSNWVHRRLDVTLGRERAVGYVVFPDEGHGFERPENNQVFFALTEAFLSVHIGGWYQPIDDAELAASSMVVEAGRQWLPGLPEEGG